MVGGETEEGVQEDRRATTGGRLAAGSRWVRSRSDLPTIDGPSTDHLRTDSWRVQGNEEFQSIDPPGAAGNAREGGQLNLVNVQNQLSDVASERRMDPEAYGDLLKQTVLKGMDALTAAKCVGDIARYGLDPMSGNLLFMGKRGSDVQTALTYNGWLAIARREGVTSIDVEYEEIGEDGEVSARAVVKRGEEFYSRTEFLSECRRGGPVWKQMPRRMLGHRAVISALRCACGTLACASAEELEEAGFTSSAMPPGPDAGTPETEDAAVVIGPRK